MIKNHPHQYVYFNQFAGKKISDNFELDYWGLSNKNSLSYISKNDKKNEIKIYVNSVSPYEFSVLLLDEKDRNRIKFTKNLNEANYLVTNHYYQKGKPTNINSKLKKDFDLFNEIKVDNMIINSIYKLK